MRITIENTDRIVEVNGLEGRVWEGETEDGIAVFCVVTRIAVHASSDTAQFERELRETPAPASPDACQAIPRRMVL